MNEQGPERQPEPAEGDGGALDHLVRKRVDELVASTARTGEPPPLEELRAVSRLERVRQLASAGSTAGPGPSPFRRNVLIAGIGTAIAVLVAATFEIPDVWVDLSFEATQLAFEPAPQLGEVVASVDARSLYASPLSRVELSPVLDAGTSASFEAAAATRALGIARRDRRGGSIKLQISPGEKTSVVVSTGVPPGRVRITLAASQETAVFADLTLDGELEIVQEPRRRVALQSPEPVTLFAPDAHLDLDIEPVDLPVSLGKSVPVRRLDLWQVESSGQGERKLSTLSSASLTILSLRDARHELGPSDVLVMEDVEGKIVELQATPKGLRGRFNGKARAVHVETGAIERSMKPSVLEWLYAEEPVKLAWGAAVGLLGVVLAIYRWWSSPS